MARGNRWLGGAAWVLLAAAAFGAAAGGCGDSTSQPDAICWDCDVPPDGDVGETDVPRLCGNGAPDPGEECDDGPGNSDTLRDACREDCRRARCGDGVTDTGEGCDDGNAVDDDACRNDCVLGSCGDGVTDPGEECDDGPANSDDRPDACRTACLRAHCGDGVVDSREACDDGNVVNDDGCSNVCRVEDGCGDGEVDPGEECDDGPRNSDTEPGACRTDCRLYRCGDCVTDPGEACDDCNPVEDDGCTSRCSTSGSCGDGVVDAGEECDDGNDRNDDACLSTCLAATCGDGFVREGVEACDTAIDYDGSCRTACGSEGTPECSADCGAMECLPPPEACNGADDDCDGEADDGFACVRGAATACITACGAWGDGTCTDACTLPAAADCRSPAETCNGLDDDCDTVVDDGFPCAAGSRVTCRTSCLSPGWGLCSAACAPPTGDACNVPDEVCNGADDDCDGTADDGFACVRGTPSPCTTTCGSAGTGTCTLDCARPDGAACTPPAEVCNGTDDDCDGTADDGFACAAGAAVPCTTACGTAGTGTCGADCTRPAAAACVPPAEVCNAADDDCDTVPDDGFACVRGTSVACTTACGSTGAGTCSDACALPSGAACAAPAETCNGRDDDCDTVIDDGFACRSGETQACTVGSCSGTQVCEAATCGWLPCNFGTAPANDTCAGAIDISAGGTFTGSTCAAANDQNATCGALAASPDLFFRLTLATAAEVLLDTVGSDYDAVLHIRSGASCATATETACDDNTAGGTPGQARLLRTLPAGTHWVVVDGAGAGSRGRFVLNVTVTTSTPPANDTCAGAIDVSAGGSFAGSTSAATDDNSYACTPGAAGGRDLWYRLTLTQREIVYLDTVDGNLWDSVLEIRRGDCGATASVVCADDQCRSYSGGVRSQIVRVLDPGTYYLVVDGYNASAAGNFSLRVQHSPCADATLIPGNGTYTGSTVGGGNDLSGGCGGSSAADRVHYAALCGPRAVTASTCGTRTAFDTVLYVRSGSCGGSTDAGCNDNYSGCGINPLHSQVTASLPQGLNFFVVDGFFSAEGDYQLTVSGL